MAVIASWPDLLDTAVGEQTIFVPVMLALIGCFDVLSVILLVAQFRDTGKVRSLALAWAFAFSLVTLLGWTAAFPGVFGTPGPLAVVPSTSSWLWVVWHVGFPVLLALALAPWPGRAPRTVAARRRGLLGWGSVVGAVGVGGLVVTLVTVISERLPVLIEGTDTTRMTAIAGPVTLPVVMIAAAITVAGAWQRGGVERWAGLAAAATLGDVLLTFSSSHRFDVGWYAGRTLTIVASAVVLFALLAEFCQVRRRLAVEGERLRVLLEHSDRLERLQRVLLVHMSDGVVMQGRNGEVLASNQKARDLIGLTADDLEGSAPLDPRGRALLPDGTPWGAQETPPRTTLRTGIPQRNAVIGLPDGAGRPRWISLDTAPVRHPRGSIEYVVTTLTDVTEQHGSALAASKEYHARYDRIGQVLAAGGPTMVFQPIVELGTGKVVGAEALARFPGHPPRPPDQWFADAVDIGLGVELELAAVRAALAQLDRMPDGAYLSVNVSPATVVAPGLLDMLSARVARRVFLELTEHTGVQDYAALTRALDELRGLGIALAVDDTGSGYASLQHILNLRPDIIKLDRGLVTGIDDDAARRALAGSLLTFAREIGATVVAEGIENAREQTVLRRLGVRYGQGFHLGRPAPLPDAGQREASRPGPIAVDA